MIPDFIDIRLWWLDFTSWLKLTLTPKGKRRYKVHVWSPYGRRFHIRNDAAVNVYADKNGTFSKKEAEFVAYRITQGPLGKRFGFDVFVTPAI